MVVLDEVGLPSAGSDLSIASLGHVCGLSKAAGAYTYPGQCVGSVEQIPPPNLEPCLRVLDTGMSFKRGVKH